VDDFSTGTLRNISFMARAAKSLPEDYFMIPAMQEIAELVDRNADNLCSEDKAILLGVGALLIREGRAETIAGIEAAIAIGKARTR